jgi:hypothetical protein
MDIASVQTMVTVGQETMPQWTRNFVHRKVSSTHSNQALSCQTAQHVKACQMHHGSSPF